jgi:hypothetical protein
MAASLTTTRYKFPFPASTDFVDVSGDIGLLSLKLENSIDEIIQGVVGTMVTDNNVETGISVVYNSLGKKLNFILDTNYIQDTAASVLDNDHIGVIATYNNSTNKILLEVTGGGGGGGGSSNASLSDMWWLGV